MELDGRKLIQALSNENEPDGHVLRQIIRDPANLNNRCTLGEALFLSLNSSFVKSVKILLEAGVSPNIRSEYRGKTPLHIACEKEQKGIILELFRYGADVNAEDDCKRTPLHEASWIGNIENMQILLQNGATVNAVDFTDRTPLSLASRDVSAVQVLLSAGADVNISNNIGMTPLHFAVVGDSPQTVRLLVRHKADTNIQDEDGNTPLHRSSDHINSAEIIRELVKGGASLNSLNNRGHSPLYCAVINVDFEATEALLRCGASFDIVKCLESLKFVASKQWRLAYIPSIAQELIRYVFIQNPQSFESIHQQLMQEKGCNILCYISSPVCNLKEFQQACFAEVQALSKVNCDCGKSSIWGSINNWKKCKCDTHQAILKFLFSGRKSNFIDAFFYKLNMEFLLEVTLNLISYFEFKESKKHFILPWPCMKEIERYVSFEDALSFLQSKQSEMDTSELKTFLSFMKKESSVKSSSEINPPCPKRLPLS